MACVHVSHHVPVTAQLRAALRYPSWQLPPNKLRKLGIPAQLLPTALCACSSSQPNRAMSTPTFQQAIAAVEPEHQEGVPNITQVQFVLVSCPRHCMVLTEGLALQHKITCRTTTLPNGRQPACCGCIYRLQPAVCRSYATNSSLRLVLHTSLTTAFSHAEKGTELACMTPGCR